MPANLPVAFGALLAGGLLLDKGLKSTRDAFSSAGQTSGVSAGGAVATAPLQGPQAAQKMLAAAQAAAGGPYSKANHASAFSQVGSWLQKFGTDCSGFVSYLLGPRGAGVWSSSYTTDQIPSAPNLTGGPGQYVTLWNNPAPGDAGHVFIQILGQWFESAGGIGIHQMTDAEAQSYIHTGHYAAWHPNGL